MHVLVSFLLCLFKISIVFKKALLWLTTNVSQNIHNVKCNTQFLHQIFAKFLRQLDLWVQSTPNYCAAMQINIWVQFTQINVRQILFESLLCAEDLSEIHPQIHPGLISCFTCNGRLLLLGLDLTFHRPSTIL